MYYHKTQICFYSRIRISILIRIEIRYWLCIVHCSVYIEQTPRQFQMFNKTLQQLEIKPVMTHVMQAMFTFTWSYTCTVPGI